MALIGKLIAGITEEYPYSPEPKSSVNIERRSFQVGFF
jgi:hypothetical protein